MTDQYKATAKQWAEVEEWVEGSECSWDHCLIELRDRVETLESLLYNTRVDYLRLSNAVAKICPDRNKFFADLIPDEDDHIGEANKKVKDLVNRPESPDASLVKQIAATLHATTNDYPDVPTSDWEPEARAVILTVAAWLRSELAPRGVAERLAQEAGFTDKHGKLGPPYCSENLDG
jgi:hypothetical protein